jgi:hypothetical protein
MMYKISSFRQKAVLTVTQDIRINSPNLSRTNVLLDYAVSPTISSMIFDLDSLSCLNFLGCWTIFHVACKAKEHKKYVFLYNVEHSMRPILVDAGILSLATFLHTKEELDIVLRREYQSAESTASLAHTKNKKWPLSEGHGYSTEVSRRRQGIPANQTSLPR